MEVGATYKFARSSAQKCRLVCDQVRGLPIDQALDLLKFSPKKAALIVRKVLDSAIANAENNNGADIDELKISQIYANEGPSFKRTLPRAKGRVDRIKKSTCHVTVILSDEE